MGNKLSIEEKNHNDNDNRLGLGNGIDIFFVKYNSLYDAYSTLKISKHNFYQEYTCYIESIIDLEVTNKDIFIIYNKNTNKFNIIGEKDESGKIVNKKYIEDVLGLGITKNKYKL